MYCNHPGPGSRARYPCVHNIRELLVTLGDSKVEGELRVGEVEDLEVSHAGMSLMSSAGHFPKKSL